MVKREEGEKLAKVNLINSIFRAFFAFTEAILDSLLNDPVSSWCAISLGASSYV